MNANVSRVKALRAEEAQEVQEKVLEQRGEDCQLRPVRRPPSSRKLTEEGEGWQSTHVQCAAGEEEEEEEE